MAVVPAWSSAGVAGAMLVTEALAISMPIRAASERRSAKRVKPTCATSGSMPKGP
ncbi:hypothetical protein D3C72_2532990 [compost metagenome]